MQEVGLIALRGVLGGSFVVAFSLIGEMLRPKSFAGIFAAAPSVALASLLITTFTTGPAAVALAAAGMIAGAVAMVAACVVGVDSVKRFRGLRGSLAAIGVWCACAAAMYVVVLR
jgi:tRNA(Ile2) C34 agmatinyltransferase TiaS